MFKRSDGAKVIVATPTLAQGLNLPAQLAVLAGDKRAEISQRRREHLKAHELLNAAARAGRAGHLANGIVLLIPEPIVSFSSARAVNLEVIQKLKSILPEDDRCVVISDPLEIVLDRLMQGNTADADVRYVVNRMAAFREADALSESTALFDLRKSFGAFAARKRKIQAEFEAKIAELQNVVDHATPPGADDRIAKLASQSGLPMELILQLRTRVFESADSFPDAVSDWLTWTVEWLTDDEMARAYLLYDVKRSVLGACGSRKDGEITGHELAHLLPGLIAWTNGSPLAEIEIALGGNPNSSLPRDRLCPRARELVTAVIPRGFSFIMGLVSHLVKQAYPIDEWDYSNRALIEYLAAAVRKGFDIPEKVVFASDRRSIASRVQLHQLWAQEWTFG
jgi:hypothetical protein